MAPSTTSVMPLFLNAVKISSFQKVVCTNPFGMQDFYGFKTALKVYNMINIDSLGKLYCKTIRVGNYHCSNESHIICIFLDR